MSLFTVYGDDRINLSVPIQKYHEATGEFEAWATVEEIDKSNEIIDIDKSFPYFEAHAAKYAEMTQGASFGNVREQHDTKKAAGKLTAPPEIRKFDGDKRGVYIKGIAVDPVTKDKLAQRVLVGVSIGGRYVGEAEKVTIGGREARKFTADPSEYSLVDNPCVENAFITVVKADGSEEVGKAGGFNPPQGFLCRGGQFHDRKDDARKCDEHTEMRKAAAAVCACCKAGECKDCQSQNGDTCSCHADCPGCEADNCAGTVSAKAVTAEVEKISTARRKSLDDSDFALPGRRYPIDTANRARNALARVAQNGTADEQAKVRAAVHAKYPSIDASQKAEPDGLLHKCLMCVSELAAIIANVQSLGEWLELVESQDDNDTAEQDIADQLEEATSTLYDALHSLVDDAQADAYQDDAQEPGETGEPADAADPVEALTDNQPVFQMAALAATLRKREGIRKLLTKSLHVRTGNESRSTMEKSAMEPEKKQPETPKAPEPEVVIKAEGFEKALADSLTKALEPITSRLAAIEKTTSEKFEPVERAIDTLSKFAAKYANLPAPTKSVKTVTKAADSANPTDKPDEKKSDDPVELMKGIFSHPRNVGHGGMGLQSE